VKILVLEDDSMLNEIIVEHLEFKGHQVCLATDGLQAEDLALNGRFDMWIFDINVPKLDGFELLKGLRAINSVTPAIYISALNQSDSVMKGFDCGADDYLKKPFDLVELDARIGYIQKRLGLDQSIITLSSNTTLNVDSRTLVVGSSEHKLSFKEVILLQFFVAHKNVVHSHEALSDVVWQDEEIPTDNALRTYIKKLRQVLGKDAIKTIHGQGYQYL
jgi:two-component system, OmpR family, response regulator